MTQLMLATAALLLAPAAAEPPVMATMPRIIAGKITSDDYPPAALRNEAEGRTSASLVIDAHGRVRRCRIAQSSGHEILDSRVCQLALIRMRFSPALDACRAAHGGSCRPAGRLENRSTRHRPLDSP